MLSLSGYNMILEPVEKKVQKEKITGKASKGQSTFVNIADRDFAVFK